MKTVSHSLIALAETLELRWRSYLESGNFDHFVEFTLSLNGLTERLWSMKRLAVREHVARSTSECAARSRVKWLNSGNLPSARHLSYCGGVRSARSS